MQKQKNMTLATYTKIAKSADYNNQSMSLGFRRFFCLPNRIKKNIETALVIKYKTANTHQYAVNFFASMTEEEYKQYVITH